LVRRCAEGSAELLGTGSADDGLPRHSLPHSPAISSRLSALDAIRRSEADLASAWDNYAGAIDAAKGGDQTRLVNLLRGHRPLEDADRTMLADYIATFPGGQGLLRAPPLGEQDFDFLAHFIVAVNRGRGRCRDEDVRAVARTAEALKPVARGVAEALKPRLPRLGQKMRDLDLEPENEEYKALEATASTTATTRDRS
jgi:hypothetical protein